MNFKKVKNSIIIFSPKDLGFKNIIFFILLFVSFSLFSQEKKQEDIKVGLVLSGGGAKGMAHIGALKVIEESGVRIDYIGGSSMGAIIGSLYAAGYSARQLDSIFRVIDFDKLLQDDLPRNAKTFFEREESEKYAVTLPFNKLKVSLPSSLSKGQNIYNLLSKLLEHESSNEDFNKLPIPFLCIATNIETGKGEVFKKGFLPRVVTASAALPTLFSPIRINDSLYVDGGVKNNYPIDEVRKMGAEIIIGIDVQDSLISRKELKSILNVMRQINNFNTIEQMEVKRKKTDIYIHPNIKNYSVVSFSEGENIIDSGEKEALLFKEELEALAKRQVSVKRKELSINKNDSLYINNVIIEGNKNYTRSYILGKLKIKTPFKTSYEKFNEGVNNLSATNNFQEINYRFFEDDKEGKTVKFNIVESESRTLLRLGIHYDDLYKTAVLLNITQKRLLTNNDITSFDVIIGDNIRYNFNYFIDKGYYWSLGLKSSFNSFNENVGLQFILGEVPPEITEINQLNFEYRELTNQFFVQTFFKRVFLARAGAEHKWLHYQTKTVGIDENNNPKTTFEDSNYFSAFGQLTFDTYDDKFFPTKGLYFHGDYHLYLFANGLNSDFEQFSIGKIKFGYATRFFNKLSAEITVEGGVKFGNKDTEALDFFVGGYGYKNTGNLIPLFGYDDLTMRGNTFLKSKIKLDYTLFKNSHILLSANVANVGNDLFETGDWINGIQYSGYGLGLGQETYIGPVEVHYSYSPETERGVLYVSVGYRF